MNSSDSDSDSGWNRELLMEVSKRSGGSKSITEEARIEQIDRCLSGGADLDTTDERSGNTALHTAVKRGYKKVVKFLLKAGARVDVVNAKGETALTLAKNLAKTDIESLLCQLNPLPSRSDQKRAYDTDDDDEGLVKSAKKLRRMTITESSSQTYDASGLKSTLHGTVYQLKHLMLILHRARKMGYSFRLATEMDAAEKFDDVVLRYREPNGDEVYRFVQAKHKQDESKAITASDLLDVKDGDFSLLKYFVSWRKINGNKEFAGSKSKNFILCTNIGIDEDVGVTAVEKPDNFLNVTERTAQPPRYKLIVENPSALWDTLKSASDGHRLARELAERVIAGQEIQLKTDLMKSYHLALAKEVVDVRSKKFAVNFILGQGLTPKAEEFRGILFSTARQLLPKTKRDKTDVRKLLGDSFLKLSSTFGRIKPGPSQSEELPGDRVDDAEISNFLDEFILAVNQPNEVELGDMIKREIGEHDQFDLPDAEFVRDSFQVKILDWFKTKQGKFLQKKDADNFFDELRVKLDSLKTMALRFEYPERLKKLGVKYRREIPELDDFVSRAYHRGANHRVFEIISLREQTLLAALQVRQTLQRRSENSQGAIFVRLETLSTTEIIDLVLGAFRWPGNHDLLVVDCGSAVADQHLETLWNPVCDIMSTDSEKRMIVIARSSGALGTRFRLERETYREKDGDCSFENLAKDSRKKLLGIQAVKFQGLNRGTSFGELLCIPDSDNLGENELKNISDILDSEVLVRLVTGGEVRVGNELETIETSRYINRTIFRHVVVKEDVIEDQRRLDLIAVSGASRELPGKFEETGDPLMDTETPPMADFTVLENGRELEQFKKLCAENEGSNVHWLKKEGRKYVWKESKGDIAYLVDRRCNPGEEDDGDKKNATYLTDDQLTGHDEPVIISDSAGMGKSTMLTYIAWRMKQTRPETLVLKVDLTNHTTALAEARKGYSTHDLNSVNGALRFLVERLCGNESELSRKVFGRMVRKHRSKLALIFDGFDEISPDYEKTVINLLHTFRQYGIGRLVVATRPHTRRLLEIKLNAFSYEIEPFSSAAQRDFLTVFWCGKFRDFRPDCEESIKRYAAAMMDKLADSIKDQKNKFTGNPLQARLVAEVFGDHVDRLDQRERFVSCREFIELEVDRPLFPDKLDLIYLYRNFVDKKFDEFFKKRGGNFENVDVIAERKTRYKTFIDKHERLALETLFDDDKLKELMPDSERFPGSSDLDISLERDGMITQFVEGRPHFGHRTYAEYFAAKFFSDKLKSPNESLRRIFIADVLLGKSYQTMRDFVNWLLSEEHADALKDGSWNHYLIGHRSKLRETLFHVAAAEGNGNIIRLFRNCLVGNPRDRRAFIHVKDSWGKTAVHRAVEHGDLDGIKLLVETTEFEVDSRDTFGWTPLYAAANGGKVEAVKYLLNKGASVDSESNDGLTPLYVAAKAGLLDVVNHLLRNGAKVDAKEKTGNTPLLMAARGGHLEVVKRLLDHGANVDSPNNDGMTPLFAAAEEGKLETVKYLHRKGADVNFQNRHGAAPLYISAGKGELEVVEYLVENGATVNSPVKDGTMPLYIATQEGNHKVVKYLLDKGADPNCKKVSGWSPLHVAAETGPLDLVKHFLEKGADVDCQNKNGITPLYEAAKAGKLDIVNHLLENGSDINRRTVNGRSALHVAAETGKLDTVKHLLRKGAIVDCPQNAGITPLFVAAEEGNLDIVKYLIDNGADVNYKNNRGAPPLYIAAGKGEPDVVKCLLDNGADVDTQVEGGATPLYIAVQEGKNYVAKYLLEKGGADANRQKADGWSPLHAAAKIGQLDMVKHLLGKGASIDSVDKDDITPLFVASEKGKLEVAKYLLDNGANVNFKNRHGAPPLYIAAGMGHSEVVKCLLDNGAKVNPQVKDGATPLYIAAQEGRLEAVKHLLDNGADLDLQVDQGGTALHMATQMDKLDVVKCLLENGAKVNFKTKKGSTPLYVAVGERDKLDMVKCLIDNGADVNSKDNNGVTPLYKAAKLNKLKIVKYLIENGADVEAKDCDGWSSLHVAARSGNLDVVKHLIDNGADIKSKDNNGWTLLHHATELGKLEVVNYLLDIDANENSQK